MKQLGYYAMDKQKNLFRFEWGSENEKIKSISIEGGITEHDAFYIINRDGSKRIAKISNYEILEIGFFTADKLKPKSHEN